MRITLPFYSAKFFLTENGSRVNGEVVQRKEDEIKLENEHKGNQIHALVQQASLDGMYRTAVCGSTSVIEHEYGRHIS